MVPEPRQTVHVTVEHGRQRLVSVDDVREHALERATRPTADESPVAT